MELANERGGDDNITVIVIRVGAPRQPAAEGSRGYARRVNSPLGS